MGAWVFILKSFNSSFVSNVTTGECSLSLMKILPLKVHINFNFKNFFSFFYIAKYFFLIWREGFGDKDVSVRLEVKVRKVSCFLVSQFPSIGIEGISHTSPGKFHSYFWWSRSIVRRYRVRNRKIWIRHSRSSPWFPIFCNLDQPVLLKEFFFLLGLDCTQSLAYFLTPFRAFYMFCHLVSVNCYISILLSFGVHYPCQTRHRVMTPSPLFSSQHSGVKGKISPI